MSEKIVCKLCVSTFDHCASSTCCCFGERELTRGKKTDRRHAQGLRED
jgi:hypothetical protein